jgi:acetyl esterase
MSTKTDELVSSLQILLLRTLMGLPPGIQRAILRKPVELDGQTLSPETQMMLALQKVAREPQIEELPLPEARMATDKQAGMVGGRQPIGALRDLIVDGATGPLAARLYIPTSRLGADPVPTLMFIHGGGMIYGGLDSHDAACRYLAENSGVQVLSVDYRLAPEHPFPAANEDCFAAYEWLVAHADLVNADPTRLAVGGDSAGGYLSATTAIKAAEAGLPLAFQLLVYPCTDFVNLSRSRKLFAEGFFLNSRFMDQARDMFFATDEDRKDPLGSVALRTEFPAGIAPAYVITAGFDPLRDEGEAYADLLIAHGVTVEKKRYPSMIHGFFNMVGAGREARGYDLEIAAKLRAALA